MPRVPDGWSRRTPVRSTRNRRVTRWDLSKQVRPYSTSGNRPARGERCRLCRLTRSHEPRPRLASRNSSCPRRSSGSASAISSAQRWESSSRPPIAASARPRIPAPPGRHPLEGRYDDHVVAGDAPERSRVGACRLVRRRILGGEPPRARGGRREVREERRARSPRAPGVAVPDQLCRRQGSNLDLLAERFFLGRRGRGGE